MRFASLFALVCAGCFCEPTQSEWVRVRVPVYRGPAQVSIVGQRAQPVSTASTDLCERPAPDISSCHPVAYVRAGALEREPNCYLDNKVKTGSVGRLMECPSGTALVVFDGATFVGESSGGYINVCASTTYDFPEGDRCTWRTEQRISGALEQGLSYAYNEAPVAGRACTLACRARTELGLVRRQYSSGTLELEAQ
jgi:hypothetical protein